MLVVIGPVLSRGSGYAFDSWSPGRGLRHGYIYHHVDDAWYARKREIKQQDRGIYQQIVTCSTLEDFMRSTRLP